MELELTKEYALRVKDMAAAEQANQMAAQHAQELKVQKQSLFDLKQEMEGLLSERDKQLVLTNEKHQAGTYTCSVIRLRVKNCQGFLCWYSVRALGF